MFDEGSAIEGDEGLEIAKIGIAGEIVKALERKGITNLFPIQVSEVSVAAFIILRRRHNYDVENKNCSY